MKRSFILALILFSICTALYSQNQAFEVTSIKQAPPTPTLMALIQSGQIRTGITLSGTRFECLLQLSALIRTAYRIKDFQIVGPDWLKNRQFEIHAITAEGTSKDMIPGMLRTLLAERFKLRAHREKKEQPVYELIVSPDGPKMLKAIEESESQSPQIDSLHSASNPGSSGNDNGKYMLSVETPDGPMTMKQANGSTIITSPGIGAVRMAGTRNGIPQMEIMKTTMASFAEWLTPLVGRPVLDKTKLKGRYHLTVAVSAEELMGAMRKTSSADSLIGSGRNAFGAAGNSSAIDKQGSGVASDPSGGAVFSSIRKLGLKLVSRKAPIDMLIIDHIDENPTGN